MYCANCGAQMPAVANFCVLCGARRLDNLANPTTCREMATQPMQSTPVASTHPWRRYFARVFDFSWMCTVAVALAVASHFKWQFEMSNAEYRVLSSIIVLGLWCAIEPVALTAFGTTPGKWLWGVKVVPKGTWAPGYGTYFERSSRVLGQGMCLGIPPFSFIAMLLSYRRLKKTGSTYWDQRLEIEVRHQRLSVPRIAGGFFLFACVVAVCVWLMKKL